MREGGVDLVLRAGEPSDDRERVTLGDGALSPSGYSHILHAVREQPWAIRPEKLATILDLLRFRAEGGRLSAEEIAERIGAARHQARPAAGSVAVIPVFGVIVQRASMLAQSSGAQGTEQIAAAFNQAVSDPNVGAIVLQVDSPGGGVYGVAELADTIFKARGSKPIVAIADSQAASAAYWIASAAESLSVTPGGELGSIGVYTAHEDLSRMADAMGVTVSLISAGTYKTEGNPFEPLGDEARAAIQARVDDYYGLFTSAVAKGRGVKLGDVRGGFGEGRMVGAQQAVKLGMADHVETMDQLLARLTGQRSARNTQRADGASPEIAASPADGTTIRAFVGGDRVRILHPHEDGHATGTVDQVSPDTAYAVVVDGMESMGPHRWYTDAELEPLPAASALAEAADDGDLDRRRRRLRLSAH